MSATCDECGAVLRSDLALMSHAGSRPCRLARTERQMAREGWAACKAADAQEVLDLAEVEYERAPVAYSEGGMRWQQADPDKAFRDISTSPKAKRRFRQPALADGIWCPAWAQPVVDATSLMLKTARFRLLRWAISLPESTRENIVRTTLSLADEDAIQEIANEAWRANGYGDE